ncbi:MAG: class 1 fructose-bisphosphatase [Halocynthiibacter sp.]
MNTSLPLDLIPENLRPAMGALCDVGVNLAHTIAKGAIGQSLGNEVGENSDGDGQKALDVLADDEFAAALKGSGVRWYASEEQESVVEIDTDGTLALAIDPLDGSSNIDVNVSIGTIFSIYDAKDDAEDSFLRKGREQIAAGYIVYGPQTGLMVTFGDGTLQFVLDPDTKKYVLVERNMRVPEVTKEFSINASNHRHWVAPVQSYIDDCLAGETGPRGKNFNMRWVGSLVAETHRILTRGGAFLYPSDARSGYENGRLRMVYECAPMAMLMEQAGGLAVVGATDVLDTVVDELHARAPLIMGSAEEIKIINTKFKTQG